MGNVLMEFTKLTDLLSSMSSQVPDYGGLSNLRLQMSFHESFSSRMMRCWDEFSPSRRFAFVLFQFSCYRACLFDH